MRLQQIKQILGIKQTQRCNKTSQTRRSTRLSLSRMSRKIRQQTPLRIQLFPIIRHKMLMLTVPGMLQTRACLVMSPIIRQIVIKLQTWLSQITVLKMLHSRSTSLFPLTKHLTRPLQTQPAIRRSSKIRQFPQITVRLIILVRMRVFN